MKNVEQGISPKIEKQTETEISPEYVRVAEQALKYYLALKPEEKVLLLKDGKTNPETAAILEQAIDATGLVRGEKFVTQETKREEIQDLLKSYETVINISVDDHEADNDIYNDIKKTGNRLLALFDLDKEAFSPDGPLSETPEDLLYRLNKMEAMLKNVSGLRITSRYGTNLEVPFRPLGERRWVKETGVISRPGEWGNLPVGEVYTTPDEFKTNGILVMPVIETTIKPHQGVDEFVKLTIKDGLIIAIDGGKSAEILRKQLAKDSKTGQKDVGDPWRPYRIAEISFGANSKARSTVADPDQPYDYPGVSVVEAEKRLGTMHIAFGDSKHGEEGVEGFYEAASHYDFVLPRTGLTVETFDSEDNFKEKHNGRKIINDGGINYF